MEMREIIIIIIAGQSDHLITRHTLCPGSMGNGERFGEGRLGCRLSLFALFLVQNCVPHRHHLTRQNQVT